MTTRAFLVILLISSAGCTAVPPVDFYTLDPVLVPAGLTEKLRTLYPRYEISSASVEVVRQHAVSYTFVLIGDGKSREHVERLPGNYSPQISFSDNNKDGNVDEETHRFAGSKPGGWTALDDDFDGYYDRRRWLGSFPYNVPARIPVSSRIPPNPQPFTRPAPGAEIASSEPVKAE